jgi:hypothetical protein
MTNDFLNFKFSFKTSHFSWITNIIRGNAYLLITLLLAALSVYTFHIFYVNGLGLSYNDARSHLDIGRRVVEGLKPGLAQLGSVWLPLPHILMVPTIWNDFMWHSGLSGAIISMASFVATGLLIVKFLEKIGVPWLGRILAVVIFVLNVNVLYLQSTAMTELLLISTMTAGVYYLLLWSKDDKIVDLVKCAFWVMLSTLVRYDGWFLLIWIMGVIFVSLIRSKGYKVTEGTLVLFCTLAALGVIGWFAWNQLIFKDALYFALGPFSARAQQNQLADAGVLATKGDFLLSLKVYLYAMFFNSYTFIALIGTVGGLIMFFDKKLDLKVRLATTALLAPFVFNVIALFFGFSVLFVQGISGDTWFNVRYGVMMVPSFAIFTGYLTQKAKRFRFAILGISLMVVFLGLINLDAVTIDDARVGSSQKNVSEVSGYLNKFAKDKKGFILISAASHDAIIFSSGLPMKRFIHEGTGAYWAAATTSPDRWARWIVMRTHDNNDSTWKLVSKSPGIKKYDLVAKYPFADVYSLKEKYINQLTVDPVFQNIKQ